MEKYLKMEQDDAKTLKLSYGGRTIPKDEVVPHTSTQQPLYESHQN
jgi:hypothetical protein